MKTFIQKVDTRSRKAMVDYLAGHFRYSTMNHWNNSTSYAHNMKVYKLGLDRETENKLWELIETDDFYFRLERLIEEFDMEHDWKWQAGFNGRSGGYLVLYQGEQVPSGYKSYCTACWQKNYKTVEETGNNICGKCGQPTRRNYERTHMTVNTFSGRGTDHEYREAEDFEDWSMYELKERVKLVQEFDQLAEDILHEAVYMANNYKVEDEEYTVIKTRKVMKEAA